MSLVLRIDRVDVWTIVPASAVISEVELAHSVNHSRPLGWPSRSIFIFPPPAIVPTIVAALEPATTPGTPAATVKVRPITILVSRQTPSGLRGRLDHESCMARLCTRVLRLLLLLLSLKRLVPRSSGCRGRHRSGLLWLTTICWSLLLTIIRGWLLLLLRGLVWRLLLIRWALGRRTPKARLLLRLELGRLRLLARVAEVVESRRGLLHLGLLVSHVWLIAHILGWVLAGSLVRWLGQVSRPSHVRRGEYLGCTPRGLRGWLAGLLHFHEWNLLGDVTWVGPQVLGVRRFAGSAGGKLGGIIRLPKNGCLPILLRQVLLTLLAVFHNKFGIEPKH